MNQLGFCVNKRDFYTYEVWSEEQIMLGKYKYVGSVN